MTKMAGVPRAKAWFTKCSVFCSLVQLRFGVAEFCSPDQTRTTVWKPPFPDPQLELALSTPRCGSGPKCRLESSPPPRLRPRTPPPHQPVPSRSIEKTGKGRGGGLMGRVRRGLREGSSNLNVGMGGGDPLKVSWGQTHIGGPSIS